MHTPTAPGSFGRIRALLCKPILWILLSVGAGVIQYVTGPEVNSGVLYLVPIALAAWYGPLWVALVSAVLLSTTQYAFVATGLWAEPPATEPTLVNTLLRGGGLLLVALLIHRARKAQELEREVTALRGMLPICLYCKQIQDAAGQWHTVEQYIGAHTDAAFTHLVCPVCDGDHRKAFLGG